MERLEINKDLEENVEHLLHSYGFKPNEVKDILQATINLIDKGATQISLYGSAITGFSFSTKAPRIGDYKDIDIFACIGPKRKKGVDPMTWQEYTYFGNASGKVLDITERDYYIEDSRSCGETHITIFQSSNKKLDLIERVNRFFKK